jgi:hypothetical protein
MELPQAVLDATCRNWCGNGWSIDPVTKHWVRACGKPTLQAVLLQCDICDVYFVPKFHEKVKYRALGAMCDNCDPPA